ncbi:hypothetical protein ACQ7B2_19755, partial [Escherichia coli]
AALLRKAAKRPTVTDLRFRGDPWVESQCDGMLSLCLGNYHLAALHGSSLDQAHFNTLLNRLRQRPCCRA